MPMGHFYDVITNGYGAMYSYASRIEPQDRWAVAAYIRALQLSQHATQSDVQQAESLKASTEKSPLSENDTPERVAKR
jgi:mono/diheme cytochrome c family protein